MELEANSILLKHEIAHKTEQSEQLAKENHRLQEQVKQLQEQLAKEIAEVFLWCLNQCIS